MNAYERVNERLDWIEKKLKELSDDQRAARNDASKAVRELCNRVEMLEPKDSVAPAPKRYRDVTAECVMTEDGLRHVVSDEESVPLTEAFLDSYRLRKVKATDMFPGDRAFIVEKEEP